MLTLDYANCLSERVGSHGIDVDTLRGAADSIASLTDQLEKTRGTGQERWRNLARDPMRTEHVHGVRAVAEKCKGRFDTMVVLGIGGSALGAIALHTALNHPLYNMLSGDARRGPRCFVVDNVDPVTFGAVMEYCGATGGGLERTLFTVVSKSGETAETAAQFMIARGLLKEALGDRHTESVVAITDPDKGTMRQICDEHGYTTLPVPDGVGGRFSVLSPVGLFPAAMCGIDIEGLLEGASAMDEVCSRRDVMKNPAATLAFLLVELGLHKGKTNHVLMPYADSLFSLADWFRQLWAESLGKTVAGGLGGTGHVGFTPIKALGTTDQHSQVQLYREGPNDKVIGFVEAPFRDAPPTTVMPTGLGVEALSYLEGRSMAELLAAEKRATEYALVDAMRPNYTIRLPAIDAHCVGQFIMLWEVATAYAGLMLGINAYDQPGVELGKQATFGLMGRKGYEEWRQRVDATLGPTGHVIGPVDARPHAR